MPVLLALDSFSPVLGEGRSGTIIRSKASLPAKLTDSAVVESRHEKLHIDS